MSTEPSPRRTGWVASGAAVAALIGWMAVSIISQGSWFQFGATVLVIAVVLGALTIVYVRHSDPDERGARRRSHVDLLVVCWVLLSLLPAHMFVGQSAASAVSSAAVSSLIELTYFTGAAVLALRILRESAPSLDVVAVPLRLFVFPAWVIASGFWSGSGLYAMIRGAQFAMLGIVGWATIAVVAGNTELRDELLRRWMRWMVVIIGALAVSGFAVGPVRSQASLENLARFAWIGTHPNVAGPLLVTALLIIVIAGDHLRVPVLTWVPFAVLFVVAIYMNQSRAALIGFVGAVVIFAWRAMRDAPRAVAIATPFLATVVYLVAVFEWDRIWGYVSRDQSSERLTGGNGRVDLWKFGLNSLDGPFDWIAGHGYGITRSLFIKDFPWAGSAHNSILAALLGVGIVGIVLLLSMYATWVIDLVRSPEARRSPLMMALAAVVVAGFLSAMFTDRIAEPSDGYAVLVLLIAVSYRAAVPAAPADEVTNGASAPVDPSFLRRRPATASSAPSRPSSST